MNHTNNVRCDQIKPLERKLFRYLCRQMDYNKLTASGCPIKNPNESIIYFIEKYGISNRMVEYYFKKWKSLGIIKYLKSHNEFKEFIFAFMMIPAPHPAISVGYLSPPRNTSVFIGFDYISTDNKYMIVRGIYQPIMPQRCVRLLKQAFNNSNISLDYGEEYKK